MSYEHTHKAFEFIVAKLYNWYQMYRTQYMLNAIIIVLVIHVAGWTILWELRNTVNVIDLRFKRSAHRISMPTKEAARSQWSKTRHLTRLLLFSARSLVTVTCVSNWGTIVSSTRALNSHDQENEDLDVANFNCKACILENNNFTSTPSFLFVWKCTYVYSCWFL